MNSFSKEYSCKLYVRPWCHQQHEDCDRAQRHGGPLQGAPRAAVGGGDRPTGGEGPAGAVGGAEGEGGMRGREDEHLDEALADGAVRGVEEGEAGVAAERGGGRQARGEVKCFHDGRHGFCASLLSRLMASGTEREIRQRY